jgi:hypothetical protein
MLGNKALSENGAGRQPEVVRNVRQTNTHRATKIVIGIALLASSIPVFPANTYTYTYDSLGRVIKVDYSDGGKTASVRYAYDEAGNRVSIVSNSPG